MNAMLILALVALACGGTLQLAIADGMLQPPVFDREDAQDFFFDELQPECERVWGRRDPVEYCHWAQGRLLGILDNLNGTGFASVADCFDQSSSQWLLPLFRHCGRISTNQMCSACGSIFSSYCYLSNLPGRCNYYDNFAPSYYRWSGINSIVPDRRTAGRCLRLSGTSRENCEKSQQSSSNDCMFCPLMAEYNQQPGYGLCLQANILSGSGGICAALNVPFSTAPTQ